MNQGLLPGKGRRPLAVLLAAFADIVELCARLLVWLGGTALIVMAFLITTEALIRKFVGVSMGSIDEIAIYVFAVSATCAFGHTLIQRAHIRIEVIRNLFGGRARLALDMLALGSFLIVFGIIAFYAVHLALDSWENGARSVTVLRVPLVWPQGIWAVGMVFTVLSGLAVAARAYVSADLLVLAPANEVETELHRSDAG